MPYPTQKVLKILRIFFFKNALFDVLRMRQLSGNVVKVTALSMTCYWCCSCEIKKCTTHLWFTTTARTCNAGQNWHHVLHLGV